jgi:hypothetical protein
MWTQHSNKKDNNWKRRHGCILKFDSKKENHDTGYCEWANEIDRLVLYNSFTKKYHYNYKFSEFKNGSKNKIVNYNFFKSMRCF